MNNPENQSVEELLEKLKVDSKKGLTEEEVLKRRLEFGENVIPSAKKRTTWDIFISQFRNVIVLLLVVAAAVSFFFGDFFEAIAIIAVILINAIIGFILESQANKSMDALKELEQPNSKVIRNATLTHTPIQDLVPGDLISFEAGDLIGADARLIEVNSLEINEAPLTGESLPSSKKTERIEEKVTIGDRTNMVFRGTSVTRGNGLAVIVFTGKDTEIGHVSSMMDEAQAEELPLNKKLDKFSKTLIWLSFVIMIPFIGIGLLQSKELYLLIETSIALVVAAIPEGLPIVATIALASGMLRLSKKKVLVRKLAAVETLGGTNIILTDKTGTLTENQLEVVETSPERNDTNSYDKLIEIMVLCNNAALSQENKHIGDPVEIALLLWAEKVSSGSVKQLRGQWAETKEIPFESETRIMTTFHQAGKTTQASMKGSTAEVLKNCKYYEQDGLIIELDEKAKSYWAEQTKLLSAKGLKVLAGAYQILEQSSLDKAEELILVGIVGLQDPARPDVFEAISECHNAGIQVIMVTGDHPETSRAIAENIGIFKGGQNLVVQGKDLTFGENENSELLSASVFSRVSPEQKLKLVEYYQSRGFVVAMTGDGVNDAPALKKADIGVAMGLRGTEVAKEAADMILQDDSFSSIVIAIKQGRIIFNNIRNFVIYLLSCNLSEILVVSFAAFLSWGSPLLPLQILFLNIVTDVFPALALGMGQSNRESLLEKPRTINEPLLTKAHWKSLVVYSMIMTISVLGVFYYSSKVIGLEEFQTNNVAFFTLAFAQLFHPFNLIKRGENLFTNGIIRNPHLWASIIFCSILLIVASLFSPFKTLLALNFPSEDMWLLIVGGSLIPIPLIYFFKILRIID
ncbi:cation-transporting P-type ATPase [Algoriphagus sp.]|uniref:cation-translocating P-type ATPase n=1 Tax=Algoriphagus sp. TaxID=1872435 RepID=UPI0025D7FA49|nr:cation-transporting P-type ATPase [Algoriphagus sp.]